MKNTLKHDGSTQLLLANVDDDTNRLFINDVEIPTNSWVGSGIYTQTINGVTISITKVADASGNIMLQKISDTEYKLVRQEAEQSFQFSHIGQIIHSTTLNTLDKVQAIYGNNTMWILHDGGYMLRGFNRYIYAGKAEADGGTETITPSGTISGGAVQSHTLTANEIPSHNHTVHDQYIQPDRTSSYTYKYAGGNYTFINTSAQRTSSNTGGGQGHTHGFTQPTFEGDDVSIMPPYKNVYIWERTA